MADNETKKDSSSTNDDVPEKFSIEVKGEEIQLTKEQVAEAYNKAQDYTPKMQEIASLKALADEYDVSPDEMAGWVKNMNEAELERLADAEKKKDDPPPKDDDLDDDKTASLQTKEIGNLKDMIKKQGKTMESLGNMIGQQALTEQKKDLRRENPDFDAEDIDLILERSIRPENKSKTLGDLAKEHQGRLTKSTERYLENFKARKAEERKTAIAAGGLVDVPEGKKISFKSGPGNVSPKTLAKQSLDRLHELETSGP